MRSDFLVCHEDRFNLNQSSRFQRFRAHGFAQLSPFSGSVVFKFPSQTLSVFPRCEFHPSSQTSPLSTTAAIYSPTPHFYALRPSAELLVPDRFRAGSVLFFGNKTGLEFYRPRTRDGLVTVATAAVASSVDREIGKVS